MTTTAPTVDELVFLAGLIHGAVITATWPQRDSMTRHELQEAFRAEAIRIGIENKTASMGFVVARCMSRSGYGS